MSAPGQTRSFSDVGSMSGCLKADMAARFASTRRRFGRTVSVSPPFHERAFRSSYHIQAQLQRARGGIRLADSFGAGLPVALSDSGSVDSRNFFLLVIWIERVGFFR